MKFKLIAVLALGLLGLTGCAINLGNETAEKSPHPTLGKQLTDLKKAHEDGALSEEEYQTQRQRLMDHYPAPK